MFTLKYPTGFPAEGAFVNVPTDAPVDVFPFIRVLTFVVSEFAPTVSLFDSDVSPIPTFWLASTVIAGKMLFVPKTSGWAEVVPIENERVNVLDK